MKRLLIGLAITAVVVVGGYKAFAAFNYGGDAYYTQITTTGTKIAQHDDKGNSYVDYEYDQPGYSESGEKKDLVFNANKSRPLRQGAYLKLTYNDNKGVTSWEAVDADQVPKAAMQKLN